MEFFSTIKSFKTRGLKQMAMDDEIERLNMELDKIKKVSKKVELKCRLSIFNSCAKKGKYLGYLAKGAENVTFLIKGSLTKIVMGGNNYALEDFVSLVILEEKFTFLSRYRDVVDNCTHMAKFLASWKNNFDALQIIARLYNNVVGDYSNKLLLGDNKLWLGDTDPLFFGFVLAENFTMADKLKSSDILFFKKNEAYIFFENCSEKSIEYTRERGVECAHFISTLTYILDAGPITKNISQNLLKISKNTNWEDFANRINDKNIVLGCDNNINILLLMLMVYDNKPLPSIECSDSCLFAPLRTSFKIGNMQAAKELATRAFTFNNSGGLLYELIVFGSLELIMGMGNDMPILLYPMKKPGFYFKLALQKGHYHIINYLQEIWAKWIIE